MKTLSQIPDEKALLSMFPEIEVLNVNAHIHTPYSFSAFTGIPEIFRMAEKENIACLGINDFFVADGYESFHNEAIRNGIMPLFNVEFIGLLKKEQVNGIRINDPNNPGRCYFCGKGLDYPFRATPPVAAKLDHVIRLSQEQIKGMITKLNGLFKKSGSQITLNYREVKAELAENLVRERHLAKAVRLGVFEEFPDDNSRIEFLSNLFGGRRPDSSLSDIPSLENEIRSNLLKAGGGAFVEEDENTFLPVDEIAEIITILGGIPCYPVLLDDRKGNYTEFESSPEQLSKELEEKGIGCIEFIPGRNDAEHLERCVNFFHNRGYVILMGTEHNTPEMIPLTCDTRGRKPLSPKMQKIAYEGACIVAAHQYKRARDEQGFTVENGTPRVHKKEYFTALGNAVIHFIQQKNRRS